MYNVHNYSVLKIERKKERNEREKEKWMSWERR